MCVCVCVCVCINHNIRVYILYVIEGRKKLKYSK